MKVSVIIPFFRNWLMTHQRLSEIYRYISTPVEIVLVNDFSQDYDIDKIIDWWKRGIHKAQHEITYVYNTHNLGFGQSVNDGVKASHGDVVIILSNDVAISGDFVSLVFEFLANDEKVLIGETLRDYDTGWNLLEINGDKKLFPYLDGFFLACNKEAWDDIGGFDPIYKKFDYEDIDLSTTALQKGYKLVPLNFRRIRHLSGQTVRKFYPDREKYTIENQKVFIEKWSKILKNEENSG